MDNNKQIEIQLSKRKLTLLFLGSLLFVGLGIWLVINPSKFISLIVRSTTAIFVSGLAGILFFGLAGLFIFKKLFDKRPGLIIDDDNIIYNSSGVSAGQVFWRDITAIEPIKIYRQNLLMLIVDNPEFYINRQANVFKRKAMQMNLDRYGSPISITANGLQCNSQELKNILDKKLADFKKNHSV